MIAAGPMERFAVGENDLRVGEVVQLVVHVAHGIKMDAGGDQRDHAKHADRERVDVVADRQFQFAKLAKIVPIARVGLWRRVVGVFFSRFALGFQLHQAEGGILRSGDSCVAGLGGMLPVIMLLAVRDGGQRMVWQPHAEQCEETQQDREHDGPGRHVAPQGARAIGDPLAHHLGQAIAHPNNEERRERHKPRGAKQQR